MSAGAGHVQRWLVGYVERWEDDEGGFVSKNFLRAGWHLHERTQSGTTEHPFSGMTYTAADDFEDQLTSHAKQRSHMESARRAIAQLCKEGVFEESAATPLLPTPASRIEVRFCAGTIPDVLPESNYDSRYDVALVERATSKTIAEFTCFGWNTCEVVVGLGSSRGPFDLLLTRRSSDDVGISLGQVQMTFVDTEGQTYKVVAGNGGTLLDSDAAQAFSDRIRQSGGGWLLESNN